MCKQLKLHVKIEEEYKMAEKKLQVSSLESIKEQASGEIIELSGWTEKPFVAKVKKVSFLGLVGEGLIPNALLTAAEVIFNGKTTSKKAPDIKDTSKVIDIVARHVLVDPSYDDLAGIDVKLTDQQKLELFQYSQQGVKGLYRFRAEQANIANNQSIGNVQDSAKSDSGARG